MFRISSSSKLFRIIVWSIISATALILSAQAQDTGNASARQGSPPPSISIPNSNKEQDGLIGPVRRVRSERAELSMKSGKLTEGPRSLLSTTTYNLQGNGIDNTYYLVAERNRSVGKEDYKHDDKGNLTEVTLRNNDGGILSREVYTYEVDVVGNWNKMVTSLVIFEGGKLRYEPIEVTYRNISYYFNEAIAKVENAPSSKTLTPVIPSPPETASETEADDHAIGSNTASRSDNTGRSSASAPQATTVTGDPSEDRMAKPQARLFSDGAANNKVITIPNATYSDEAKLAGVTGTVVVIVEIDTEGRVVSARAASGHAMLRAAAVEAALKARFSPTSRTNQPSRRSGVISFTFSLLQ